MKWSNRREHFSTRFDAIDLAQHGRIDHLKRIATGPHPAIGNQQDLVGKAQCLVEVVDGDQDDHALLARLRLHEGKRFDLAATAVS